MKWISVEDKLPENDDSVLVFTNFSDIYTCRLPVILKKNESLCTKFYINEKITHWMPLPEPPKEDL